MTYMANIRWENGEQQTLTFNSSWERNEYLECHGDQIDSCTNYSQSNFLDKIKCAFSSLDKGMSDYEEDIYL